MIILKTTDTSLSRKDDMSHTSRDDFTEKIDKTITCHDEEHKEETSKIK